MDINLTILTECMELDRQGQHQKSITRLSEAILSNAKESKLFYQRGIRYERLGKFSLALNDYSIAVGIDPMVEYYVSRGRLLCNKLGRAEEAVKDFKAAITADPISPIPHQHLSLCYLLMCNVNNAYEYAQNSVRLDPNDSISYSCLAKCEIAEKKWSSAIEHSKIATQLDPKSSPYWGMLGDSYLGAKDVNKAIKYYKKAIRITPIAAHYIRLARIQLDMGNIKEAIANLELAKEFDLGEVDRILVEGYLGVAQCM